MSHVVQNLGCLQEVIGFPFIIFSKIFPIKVVLVGPL